MDKKVMASRLISYYTNLPLSKPEMINLGMTHRCNFRCKICNTREENVDTEEEMNINELKEVIEEIGEWGDIGISFAGGEPLVRKDDVIECIEFAKKKGLTTYMTTNGSLIDEETAKRIVESDLDFLSVSLDGATAETNDYIRTPGSYENAVQAIDLLKAIKKEKDADIKIGLTTVVTDKNLEELEEIHDFVLEKELHEVNYNPYVPDNSFMGEVDYENDEFWIPEERIEKLRKVSDRLIELKEDKESIGTSLFILENMPEYFEKKEDFSKGKCLAGQSYMYIKPNGNVDVCGKGPSFSFREMSVKERSVKEIWRSLNFFLTRLKIKNCQRPCLMLCFPHVNVKNFLKKVVD